MLEAELKHTRMIAMPFPLFLAKNISVEVVKTSVTGTTETISNM